MYVLCHSSRQQREAVETAQREIHRLRLERERSEESMKKAFMRGVCALNIEALGLFGSTEGRPEQPPVHDQHGMKGGISQTAIVSGLPQFEL